MILLLENRDSFSFNIVQALRALGAQVRVESARALSVAEVGSAGAAGVVIGPGPGRPEDAGCSVAVVRALAVPVLGLCLGHQALGAAFGAQVVRAQRLVHGSTVRVTHANTGLWSGLPQDFALARYNSLALDEASLPADLLVDARDEDGDVMGVRHVELPLFGVQGHPESILSLEHGGRTLLGNFLARCELATAPR